LPFTKYIVEKRNQKKYIGWKDVL